MSTINPYEASPGSPAPTAATNSAGRIALILGVVGLALGLVFVIVQYALIYTGNGMTGIGALSAVNLVAQGAVAVATVIFGLLGVTRPGLPRVAAGIGLGLGIAGIAGVLVGLVGSLIPLLLSF